MSTETDWSRVPIRVFVSEVAKRQDALVSVTRGICVDARFRRAAVCLQSAAAVGASGALGN
jgi:hypothetical protein